MSFKLPSMSINKMIHHHNHHHQQQHHESEQQQSGDTIPKKIGKVKVFYSFKNIESTCLCTFDIQLSSQTYSTRWIPISLKKCLLSVCSSCPDQLLRNEGDMAIYTANVEESNIGPNESLKDVRSTVIWEGHGLLSTILRDDANNDTMMVSGQITPATVNENYDYTIQVLVQMHPIRRSQDNSNNTSNTLPSMKSILASDDKMYTSPPYNPDTSTSRLSSFKPYQTLSPPSSSQPSLRSELDFNHTLTTTSPPYQPDSSNWPRRSSPPHPYEDIKRRKLTPPLSYNHSPPPSTTYQPPMPPSQQQQQQLQQSPNSLMPITKSPTSSFKTSPPATTMTTSNYYHTANPISQQQLQNNNNNNNNNAKLQHTSNNSNRKTNIDTFYHQSRRKKRDTKPPNANDVRPYVQIEKNLQGQYILPVEVDSWTVLDLGHVVWDREAFHNQRYIYPVGYCVKKWYRSMVDPHSDTQYTCQILDGGDEPIFQLEADDNPGEVYAGPTTTTIWTIVVRRAFAIRNMEYGHNPVGPDFFGLRKNTIAKMIQDLPNADKCKNYVWQTFEAITTNGNKGKALRRSNTRASTSSSSTSSTGEPTSTPLPQPTQLQQRNKQQPTSPMSEDIPVN